MKFNLSKERCLRLADLEGDATIAAGSPDSLKRLEPVLPTQDSCNELTIVRGIAFGRFVEMKRRDLGLSVEELAIRAGIEIVEAVSMEQDSHYKPEPTAVIQLAKTFGMAQRGLFQLAGLIEPKSARFITETTKFAARSESTAHLTKEERELLEHYASILAEDA